MDDELIGHQVSGFLISAGPRDTIAATETEEAQMDHPPRSPTTAAWKPSSRESSKLSISIPPPGRSTTSIWSSIQFHPTKAAWKPSNKKSSEFRIFIRLLRI
eukprot:gb/GEZJ01001795.1/.p5 GENE.gb/GEZJ01001795.1/~~gb/GEZJ01001795.1/.p5  ORF type:complete len:102 (-),score=13.79 gb/GEZJ01001795.1/:995-1300(-)